MEKGIWVDISKKSVQDWLEYESDDSNFVVRMTSNFYRSMYLKDDLPMGISTLIKEYSNSMYRRAEILILPD